MGLPSFMRSVVDRNVVIPRIPVMPYTLLYQKSLQSRDYFSTKSPSLPTHFFYFCVRRWMPVA